MVFKGISIDESIWFQSQDTNIMYRIILGKAANDYGNFSVRCSHDSEWGYNFYSDDSADYERIKFNIMDTLFNCDNEEDILPALSKVIEDGFSDIIYIEA